MDVMDGVGMCTVGGDTAEVYSAETLATIDTTVLIRSCPGLYIVVGGEESLRRADSLCNIIM